MIVNMIVKIANVSLAPLLSGIAFTLIGLNNALQHCCEGLCPIGKKENKKRK